jgi:hypothetical protein
MGSIIAKLDAHGKAVLGVQISAILPLMTEMVHYTSQHQEMIF